MTDRRKFMLHCRKGDLESTIQYSTNVYNTDMTDAFELAIQNGHLSIVKWIYERHRDKLRPFLFYKGFGDACENGHLHVAKWLLEINQVNYVLQDLCLAFNKACRHHHQHIAQWIYELNPEIMTNANQPTQLFIILGECAIKGNLGLMQWILHTNPLLNVSGNEDCVFSFACTNGHYEMAVWLLQYKPTINISAQNDNTLTWSCYHGHYHIVSFLLEQNPVNVSIEDEKPFRFACERGHLDIAKLLLEKYPEINVHARLNYAFRLACFNEHTRVFQWLCDINPYLFDITYNNKGKILTYHIRSERQARWLRRRYAMWMASLQSPNVNSIWFRLPDDVSRQCILYL